MTYLVVVRDYALCLIGPFPTADAAADWAEASSDDPRWQCVELEDVSSGAFMVSVFAPQDARARDFMALSP